MNNNIPIFNKGGHLVRKYQLGSLFAGAGAKATGGEGITGLMGNMFGGAGGAAGGLGGLAGGAGKALGSLIGGSSVDPMEGAAKAGLDADETAEIERTASGAGMASGILGTVGDLAGKIPGPWGDAASGVLNLAGTFVGNKAEEKQAAKMEALAANKAVRDSDTSKQDALKNLGGPEEVTPLQPGMLQPGFNTAPPGTINPNGVSIAAKSGGLLYNKANIKSFLSGGSRVTTHEKGGSLKWDHKFNLNLPEVITSVKKQKGSVKVFKRGGKFNDPDKTNIIVAGARHHEDNNLGDKGIPVIDETGDKVFEIEVGELILTKEATGKLEGLMAKYKEVEIHEDKAAVILKNLGKYFKSEIKENMHDYQEEEQKDAV